MAKLLKLRRGTTTQHGSFTGAEGEVTVDTDKETLVVHDGSTAGGHPVAAEDMANVSSSAIAGRLANDSIAPSKIAAGTLPSDVTVASANIVNGTIATDDIGGGQITTAKIANDAITEAKIADSAVSTNQIANTAVSSAKLANDSVVASKIADDAVTTAAIADGAVNNARLGADSVTNAKIADDSIDSEHYVDGSIDTAHIANSAITSAKIADNTISNSDINSSAAIAGTKISPDFGSQNVVTTGSIQAKSASSTLGIGSISGDNYVQIEQETASSSVRGFSNQHGNASVFENKQGSTEQYLVLGDTSHNSNSSLLGVGTTDGTTYYNRLNLSGSGNLDIAGNFTLSGTVDGRDVASDGSKLDGIESGATADQTASEIVSLVNGQNIDPSRVYSTGGTLGRDSNDYIYFANNSYLDVVINGSTEFRFESDGDFHADGDVIAQSTTISSDRKLKENIEVIPNALDKVQALNGVTFDWKRDGTPSAGVIAQEVQGVLPEAVKEVTPVKGGDSHLSVNYHALTSILIEAIKELKAEIEELKGGK